jgi:IMP dehydrogenase
MFTQGYTFDDVLLIPKYSEIQSRSDVDLSVELPRGIKLQIPLVSSNMKSVTGVKMALAIKALGGLAILHRFDLPDQIVSNFIACIDSPGTGIVGASIGIKEKDLYLAEKLYSLGCKVLCVDVAHGNHKAVKLFVQQVRASCPDVCLIAGNIVTENGALLLWNAGADIIKVGVGPGSICSTRIETGNGYPQLSALKNVCEGDYKFWGTSEDFADPGPMFIADGGIKNAGDCVKALCFADLVMIGNLFAGTDEAPGEVISVNGQKFKEYAGSSTHKQKHIEGVVGLVPYKGSVSAVTTKLVEGIRSGCSYQGVDQVRKLQTKPEFVVISNAGLKESHPHDVKL